MPDLTCCVIAFSRQRDAGADKSVCSADLLHRVCGRAYVHRLKDFRRIATRYDRLAVSFLGTVHITAIVSYWL
ncbi:transposase [Skermanella stibiiresistens SB22]|uniref:Transposase n=1 Tax=Skermanella stibiiresistens SB22 TaxID=1385369 RepID=W9H0J1_9PROT|nr:transposase [Skermanella stibiiresistens SB22]